MSPQSIVCATCDATVPYGRLSCPSCGELLASVAGAARSVNGRGKKGRASVAERPAPAAEPVVDAGSDAAAAGVVDQRVASAAEAAEAAPSSTVAWPTDLARSDGWPSANTMQPGPPPAASRAAVPIPSSPAAPGAYVPPIVRAEPSGPPAPARAWAGQGAAAAAASRTEA